MEKAKAFEEYFTDEKLSEIQKKILATLRKIVHDIYPDVEERVSYAMPGFYPPNAPKATDQLFLFMANKKWLGLYGTFGFSEIPSNKQLLEKYQIEEGKGSLHIPYDFTDAALKEIVTAVLQYNLHRFQNQ